MIKICSFVDSLWKGRLWAEETLILEMPPELNKMIADRCTTVECTCKCRKVDVRMTLRLFISPSRQDDIFIEGIFHPNKSSKTKENPKKVSLGLPFSGSYFFSDRSGSNDASSIKPFLWTIDMDNCEASVEKQVLSKQKVQIRIHQDILHKLSSIYVSAIACVDVRARCDKSTPIQTSEQFRYLGSLSTTEMTDTYDDISGEGHTIIFHGCSKCFRVVDYALVVEEDFKNNNPYVCQFSEEDPTTFAWYCKCGGDNAGLDVLIRLVDARGRSHNPFQNKKTQPLVTELVYSDGSPTPIMPVNPLKARRSSVASKNPLFRSLRPPPILGESAFSFRIEEVSYHHPGYKGFKLKVSVSEKDSDIQRQVHPGLLEETIVVRSKPKLADKHQCGANGNEISNEKGLKHSKILGGRSPMRRESFLMRLCESNKKLSSTPYLNTLARYQATLGRREPQLQDFSSSGTSSGPSSQDDDMMVVTMASERFVDFFLRPSCMWCGIKGGVTDGSIHGQRCYFRTCILPWVQFFPCQSDGEIVSPEEYRNDFESHRGYNRANQLTRSQGQHQELPPNFPLYIFSRSHEEQKSSSTEGSILGLCDEKESIRCLIESNDYGNISDGELSIAALEEANAHVEEGPHLIRVFEGTTDAANSFKYNEMN